MPGINRNLKQSIRSSSNELINILKLNRMPANIYLSQAFFVCTNSIVKMDKPIIIMIDLEILIRLPGIILINFEIVIIFSEI